MSDELQQQQWERLLEGLNMEVKKTAPNHFRMELSFSHRTAATLAIFAVATGNTIGEVIDHAVHCLAAMTEEERQQIAVRRTRVMMGTDDELRRLFGEFEAEATEGDTP